MSDIPKPKLLYEDCSIVILGEFQPSIFHPQWFLNNGLLNELEAKDAKIKVVTPVVTDFSVDDWLYVFINEARLQLKTIHIDRKDELIDLMIGICNQIKYMPIIALGINVDKHTDLFNKDIRDKLGWVLAPPENWKNILSNPGVRSLIMEETKTEDITGFLRVKIEPSTKYKGNTAVYIQVNDHYDIIENESETGSQKVVNLLKEIYFPSIDRSIDIINKTINIEV